MYTVHLYLQSLGAVGCEALAVPGQLTTDVACFPTLFFSLLEHRATVFPWAFASHKTAFIRVILHYEAATSPPLTSQCTVVVSDQETLSILNLVKSIELLQVEHDSDRSIVRILCGE